MATTGDDARIVKVEVMKYGPSPLRQLWAGWLAQRRVTEANAQKMTEERVEKRLHEYGLDIDGNPLT